MKRVVVLSQPGALGTAWCQHAAARLSQQLGVPRVPVGDAASPAEDAPGWVATTTVDALSRSLLRSADTAVWLHFLPPAMTRVWLRGLRARLAGALHVPHAARLADLRDSVMHMAWTPHVHRLLRHPGLAHLQVFHLRSPDETDFWLRAQEHRLPLRQPVLVQPA